jgi:hypothetical protein
MLARRPGIVTTTLVLPTAREMPLCRVSPVPAHEVSKDEPKYRNGGKLQLA